MRRAWPRLPTTKRWRGPRSPQPSSVTQILRAVAPAVHQAARAAEQPAQIALVAGVGVDRQRCEPALRAGAVELADVARQRDGALQLARREAGGHDLGAPVHAPDRLAHDPQHARVPPRARPAAPVDAQVWLVPDLPRPDRQLPHAGVLAPERPARTVAADERPGEPGHTRGPPRRTEGVPALPGVEGGCVEEDRQHSYAVAGGREHEAVVPAEVVASRAALDDRPVELLAKQLDAARALGGERLRPVGGAPCEHVLARHADEAGRHAGMGGRRRRQEQRNETGHEKATHAGNLAAQEEPPRDAGRRAGRIAAEARTRARGGDGGARAGARLNGREPESLCSSQDRAGNPRADPDPPPALAGVHPAHRVDDDPARALAEGRRVAGHPHAQAARAGEARPHWAQRIGAVRPTSSQSRATRSPKLARTPVPRLRNRPGPRKVPRLPIRRRHAHRSARRRPRARR